MDGNDRDTDNDAGTDATDEGARDEPTSEAEKVDETLREGADMGKADDPPGETEPDEAVESMTLLDLARGMASGEITRDAGRTWLAENHPD